MRKDLRTSGGAINGGLIAIKSTTQQLNKFPKEAKDFSLFLHQS